MATPAFLVRLMGHASLSLAAQRKLGPEDSMAYAFVNELRVATLQGRLSAVWTHPANELAGMVTFTKGKPRVPVQVAVAKALGLITGTSDYLFLSRTVSLALEAKSGTGRLTGDQRAFRDWCDAQGVPFHIFRTVAEGLDLLEGYGIYRRAI